MTTDTANRGPFDRPSVLFDDEARPWVLEVFGFAGSDESQYVTDADGEPVPARDGDWIQPHEVAGIVKGEAGEPELVRDNASVLRDRVIGRE